MQLSERLISLEKKLQRATEIGLAYYPNVKNIRDEIRWIKSVLDYPLNV